MRLYTRLILVVISIVLLQASIQAEPVRNLSELKEQMTQRGKPALVIAGADWCVYCREMAKELGTSPELQPLQKQFAIFKIDVDTPVWAAAKRAFEFEGKGVPAVFVFRADGKKLHAGSGKPANLKAFLEQNLKNAGHILSPQEAKVLGKDLPRLQRALKRKDLAEAIKISSAYELSDCYAQPAIAITAVKKKIEEQLVEQLAELEKKLKETPDNFESIYQLINLKQTCSASRTLVALVQKGEDSAKENGVKEEIISQAELLLQADRLHKARKRRQAQEIYSEILKQYPDSDVAGIVKQRMQGKTIKPAATASTTPTDETQNLKKAESYLRLAKQLLKVKSARANSYLEKTIEAAPDSEFAKQARELLK